MTDGKKILQGMRVLDLTRMVAAPLATQILGDLGADIIKIERPGAGDDIRRYGPVYADDVITGKPGDSSYYIAFNRNKRSVTVDFTKPAGRDILKRIAAISDVLVENYKVGDLAEHGLDYASLKKINPGLIYCSVTGYGQTGPYAPRPGLDAVFQAQSGFAHVIGYPDASGVAVPQVTGIVAVDLLTGQNAAIAVLGALLHRERTGEGQAIDIALLDSAIAYTSYGAQQYLVSGREPVMRAPVGPLEIVECSDGPVLLLGTRDPPFIEMSRILGRPELAQDPRFDTAAKRHENKVALRAILMELARPWKRQELLDQLGAAGVMAGALNSVSQVFSDPQVVARGMAQPLPDRRYPGLKVVASPLRFSETPPVYERPAPGLGEHTGEVLRELLDYDDAGIAELRKQGVI